MNQRWIGMAVAICLGMLVGCAGNATDDPVASSEGLTWVDKADFTGQVLWLDLTVAPLPLTAAQMGDTSNATPVEVRFYDDWAIAWWAPDGYARNEHFMNAIGVWRVVENAEIEPLADDDVAPGGGEASTNPPAPPAIDTGAANPGFSEAGAAPSVSLPDDDRNLLPFAALDWYGDFMEEWIQMTPGFHPGCI